MSKINFNLLNDIREIPQQWIYSYYLKLKEPLDGRRIRIKSPFNSERTPSMYLYVSDCKYRWKDFSSGKSGKTAVTLARDLFEQVVGKEVTLKDAMDLIKDDYKRYCEAYGPYEPLEIEGELSLESDFMCEAKPTEFEQYDLDYWAAYGIDKALLDQYNVKALKWFQLCKMMKNSSTVVKMYPKVQIRHAYGYYTEGGRLAKVYNPYYVDLKHITVENYILGRDQIQGKSKTCIICSSMKDMLAVKGTGVDVEVLAPISERSIIPAKDITYLNEIYTNLLTMFDNDRTGIQAMILYKELYGINFVHFPHEKDFAEFRKICKDEIVARHELTRKINPKVDEPIY